MNVTQCAKAVFLWRLNDLNTGTPPPCTYTHLHLFECDYFVYHFRHVFSEFLSSDTMEIKRFSDNVTLMTYFNTVINFNIPEPVFLCQSLHDAAQKLIDGHIKICLTGPKGCGKSVTTAVLFLMLQSSGVPCLYLTQMSFQCAYYFKWFIEQHIAEEARTTLLSELSSQGVQVITIQRMIQTIVDGGTNFYLFIDFGTIHTAAEDGKILEYLLQISNMFVLKHSLFTNVICVSSGFVMGNNNPKFTNRLKGFCKIIQDKVDQFFF